VTGSDYDVVEVAMAASCPVPASLVFTTASDSSGDAGVAAQFPLTPCPQCTEPRVVRYRIAVGTLTAWRESHITRLRIIPCPNTRRQTLLIAAVSLVPR
jgi:hypothetical protein